MNQDQPELTLEESIKEVMQTLPPIIHDYLTQGKYTAVAKDMMAKYRLRIDQGGVLEREIMLLLMGIENPDEFSKALAEEAKLDQKTISGIVEDVNEQIFVPLREQMRSGAETKQESPKPVMTTPQPQGAAAMPPRVLLAEVKPPQVLIPPPPISPRPALRDVLATVMKAPLAPQRTAPPPLNLPLAINKVESQMPLPPKLITPPAQSTPSKPITPITSYSTDPYREPIDEK